MKVCLLFVIAFMPAVAATAQQKFTPVSEASSIHFVIRNFGINTGGDIGAIKGGVYFDKTNLSQSSFNITAAVATIDTDNTKRDKHLLSADYFNEEKYPNISMTGKPVLNKTGILVFNGTLTIKNISRPISFPFTVKAQSTGYVFEAAFKINRLDFQVGKQSAVLSDDVKVLLKVVVQ